MAEQLMKSERVSATPAALELIERLAEQHGPLVFLQSGGCCEGSSPMCFRRDDLNLGPGDLSIGVVGPATFYVDSEQDERWGRPTYVIGMSPGASDTFSIEGSEDVHFILVP